MDYHKSLNCSDVSCACVFQCFNFSFERVAMLMAILRKSVWSLSVFSCPSDCFSLSQGTLHTPEEPMLTAEVGSEFKIDCSYLSPNVSIATSIERSTAGEWCFTMGGGGVVFVFQSASTKLSLDGWRVAWPFHLLVREMLADFPQKYRSQLLWDSREDYLVRFYIFFQPLKTMDSQKLERLKAWSLKDILYHLYLFMPPKWCEIFFHFWGRCGEVLN